MTYVHRRRWGDNDKHWGPFTWSYSDRYRPVAMVLSSGGDEDRGAGCYLRFSARGRTLLIDLPQIIKPWRNYVDLSKYEWAQSGGYWDIEPREFGFSYHSDGGGSVSGGFLIVYLGPQTNDSTTTKSWSKHMPWKSWRHVRRSFYDLDGAHYYTEREGLRWGTPEHDAARKIEEACPSRTFYFRDFDGEGITATCHIEEREWRFGTGWFKWLSYFRRPMIRRSLDIRFSGETGKRKGSWKGGTIGHSIDMQPGEMHEAAFRRYCAEHEMTFDGEMVP